MTIEKFTVFLDIDGVLHPEWCHESKQFSNLHMLEQFSRENDFCDFVISSNWRHTYGLEVIKRHFGDYFENKIVGVTKHYFDIQSEAPKELKPFERHWECLFWQRKNGRSDSKWCALDVYPWLFEPYTEHLVLVDGVNGLSERSMFRLYDTVERLKKQTR